MLCSTDFVVYDFCKSRKLVKSSTKLLEHELVLYLHELLYGRSSLIVVKTTGPGEVRDVFSGGNDLA